MNLFKRIGNIFMKMAPRRKPAANVTEQKSAPAPEPIKEAPIRDIEELIVKSQPTTSPYFSPIKTRNQKLNPSAIKKPISKLASQVKEASISIKNVETKKAAKKTTKTKKTENESEVEEAPIEVVKSGAVAEKIDATTVETKKINKKVPKVSSKTKETKNKATEKAQDTSSLPEAIAKKDDTPSSPVKVTKRKSKEASKSPEAKVEKWEPNNWRQMLENIRTMRANVPAPVDTMGCDKCSDESADEKTRRFHVLLSLMLSSQTKDEVTHEAMGRLRSEGNCTPQGIAEMEPKKLETLLYPVSFYKNKTKYLQNTSKILVEQYNSDIPNDIKSLIKLPGVGPKMAHICMNAAWDIVTGIGVDVHVHRIANRLGWVRKETKQPEQTRKELESWMPSDHWKEVNHLLVGFGQTICSPVKPKCGECLNKSICPGAFYVKPKKVKPDKVVL